MKLLDLQKSFFEELRSPPDAAPTSAGMRIYRNNYRLQLASVLKDTFARVRLWIGDEAFEAAAAEQIRRSPPASWTLDAYGRDFPALLKTLYPGDPEVAELAWLDSAMSQAFVTADVGPVSAEQLAATTWDSARILFVPLQLSEATTNAAEIWRALDLGQMPPPGRRRSRRGGHLVWRRGHAPRFRFAELREYRAVSALYLGLPFSHVCTMIEADLGASRAVNAVGKMLGRWLADGLVARVESGSGNS